MGGRYDFSKLDIVRSAMRKDLFYFGLPAFMFFVLGIRLSADADQGRVGLKTVARTLFQNLDSLSTLSTGNIVGGVLIFTGLPIVLIAPITLGRFYSSSLVIREDAKLVTDGIYRVVRHPIYLGALMICFGIPIFASSADGFLAMLALVPIVLNRIRMEENLLIEAFGDAYRDYQATTRKLIPFVY